MAAPVRIAVIGTGIIGPRHAKSVKACPDATLLCIVDPSASARTVADELDVILHASVDEMLRSDLPDAAIICTPNATHASIGTTLLAAGVHVLVEKPIATTVDDGQRLIDAAHQHKRQLLVGHHRRFNPYVTAAKRVIDGGEIGKVIAMSGTWATYKPPAYFQEPSTWRAEAGSGGPILINFIHEADTLQYLFGPIVRVHAEPLASQRGHAAEEGAAILLRFASGIVGTFLVSDATPSGHNFESATGENPMIAWTGEDAYRIFGSDGSLSFGDMKIMKHAEGLEKSWSSEFQAQEAHVATETPFDEQVKHLVRVTRGEEEPRCSGKDGLSALRVCVAIKNALVCNEAVIV